ncbi:MAG: serine/threonine protein kinase [Planctomycetaceae bacterium]|jgi:serine/threonine protein kinase|nr:serine/threonine protein kinase [Planctomycetaceae bacterium]
MVLHLVCECGNDLIVSEINSESRIHCTRCGRSHLVNKDLLALQSAEEQSAEEQSVEETQIFSDTAHSIDREEILSNTKDNKLSNNFEQNDNIFETSIVNNSGNNFGNERTRMPANQATVLFQNKMQPETVPQKFPSDSVSGSASDSSADTSNEKTVQMDQATQIFDPKNKHHKDDFEINTNSQKKNESTQKSENSENDETKITSPITSPDPHLSGGIGSRSSSGRRNSSLRNSELDLSQRVMKTINRPSAPLSMADDSGTYGIHRILRTHQKGGMGRILIAYDQYLKRDIALKELHPEVAEDESIVRRFIGEAEITAQLEHPGIVPIHTLGLDKSGNPYYTMKLIKGHTFQEAIKAYHRNPTRQELLNLVRRLVSICKTMAFAHNKGVIHRDLKPANIMLGEHGETLVMDWGLAKPFAQSGNDETYISVIHHRTAEPRPELTMVGAIVGTPAFMSPEQASPEENTVGPLSDVFSLGTILYYLLSGQTAFSGRSTQEVLNKVRAASPPRPSEIKTNVPLGLEAICAKAMAKESADRYQSATEFADDLCRWLDGEPVKAQKETMSQKIWRWIDHHRLISISIPAILILGGILMSLGILLDRTGREKNHRNIIQSILNDPVDLTDYTNVLFEGSRDVILAREPRQTGGVLLACRIVDVPKSEHGSILITAPDEAAWDLTRYDAFTFSLFEGLLESSTDFSSFYIRIGKGSSYFEYRPSKEFWAKRKRSNWFPYTVALSGSANWNRTEFGTPSLNAIKWIEFHFDVKKPISFHLDHISFKEKIKSK